MATSHFDQDESEPRRRANLSSQGTHLPLRHSFVLDDYDLYDDPLPLTGSSGPQVIPTHAASRLPVHNPHPSSASLNSFDFSPSSSLRSPSYTAVPFQLPAVAVTLNSRASSRAFNNREDFEPDRWYQLGNEKGARYQLLKADDLSSLSIKINDIQKALSSNYSDESGAAVVFVCAARDLGHKVPQDIVKNNDDHQLYGSLPELEVGDTMLSIHRIPETIYDQEALRVIDANERKLEYGLIQTCDGPGQIRSQLIMANDFKIEDTLGQLNENYNLLLALISQQVDKQIKLAGGSSIHDVNSLTLGGPASPPDATAYELAYIHFCHLSRVGCQYSDGTSIDVNAYENSFPKGVGGALFFDQQALVSCSEIFTEMASPQRSSSGLSHEDGTDEEKYVSNSSPTPDFTGTQSGFHHKPWTSDSQQQNNSTFSSPLFNPVLTLAAAATLQYSPTNTFTASSMHHTQDRPLHLATNPSSRDAPGMFTPANLQASANSRANHSYTGGSTADASLGPSRTSIPTSPLQPLVNTSASVGNQDNPQSSPIKRSSGPGFTPSNDPSS